MTMGRCSLAIAVATLLCGCHLFRSDRDSCHKPQEYQRAASVAPLKVPAGTDAPNVAGALVIPAVDNVPPPPGPHDPCLDDPPRYKPAQPVKPGAAAPAVAPATAPAPGAEPAPSGPPAPAAGSPPAGSI